MGYLFLLLMRMKILKELQGLWCFHVKSSRPQAPELCEEYILIDLSV